MTEPVQIVRYAELVPCRTAFIDAHTPGSDQKENFTIIGGGVSEATDQHVHIKDTPGFNVGAAGQPPKCTTAIAFVEEVMSGAIVSAVIDPESGSTSAKTGLAPRRTALDAVAINVRGAVINSSPWPRPIAK